MICAQVLPPTSFLPTRLQEKRDGGIESVHEKMEENAHAEAQVCVCCVGGGVGRPPDTPRLMPKGIEFSCCTACICLLALEADCGDVLQWGSAGRGMFEGGGTYGAGRYGSGGGAGACCKA